MDQSCSESDISLSPSQILERLQMLRQLQLLQRGKLHKQRLEYQETSKNSSITEIVSHFSNSTSYNTFRSLLQSSEDVSNNITPRSNVSDVSQKVKQRDLIEGVSILNLSQESEFVVNSPISSRISAQSIEERKSESFQQASHVSNKSVTNKQISLDEIPILSPKKDFEMLVIEKLQNEDESTVHSKTNTKLAPKDKKPFLKRGEGMGRFGINKKDLTIQNTKSLPWKKKNLESKSKAVLKKALKNKVNENVKEDMGLDVLDQLKLHLNSEIQLKPSVTCNVLSETTSDKKHEVEKAPISSEKQLDSSVHSQKNIQQLNLKKGKPPLFTNKGKTWAAVLTKEQNDFLTQLKQSDYYKNFASPAKSIMSDSSCYENMSKFSQEKELAEQNLFELLENKVSNESFNLENSFFNNFLKRQNMEQSGESTPLILKRCLATNPDLMHIFPNLNNQGKHKNKNSAQSYVEETCPSDYTDCCSDTCSSVSTCCSCKTVEQTPAKKQGPRSKIDQQVPSKKKMSKEDVNVQSNKSCQDDITMKANMAEMNEKLIKTSELLKERLHELEDEIETFRKENANLSKLREEVDLERQKFYEEKKSFEQKFNEDKILAEYYLAEEKEKLTKQKQMYDRYVREIRGRLSKKDKDEVVNLKQEISKYKEEVQIKDAKSTATIARLRNQIKILEKDKKDMQENIEKLKKENRRIQHSNDITRRLTNMKYLEEINKKLTHMSNETRSEVAVDNNVKYKAYEIERQSRSRRVQNNIAKRPRAKSVPNINVKSRYAKYFSQKDSVSEIEPNINIHNSKTFNNLSDSDVLNENEVIHSDDTDSITNKFMSDEDNNLEKIYIDTFCSTSPNNNRKSTESTNSDFFLHRSNSATSSVRNSKSPAQSLSPHLISSRTATTRSKSPISILSSRSNRLKSPISVERHDDVNENFILRNSSNRSKSPSQVHPYPCKLTATQNDQRERLLNVSPEPCVSKTSLGKTNLNPTETNKPDGSRELRFPNGNVKHISADGKYSKFVYYNGDVKENFYNEGRIKYYYAETKTFHTTHADGLEVLEFPDGQVEKRYKDGSTEVRLPNGSVRYHDPKNMHVREEWRFPDGAALTISADGEQRIVFANGQVEVHAKDHKRREFPDGTVKLVYNDGTSETRYASGRVRIKNMHGNLIMDSAPG